MTEDPRAKLLRLSQLKGLELIARKKSASFLQGNRRSIFRGVGSEFAELRDYVPGDDLRHIDWGASARRPHKLIVREFEQERNTNVMIALDISLSMTLGQPQTRIKMAVEAAAALAYSVMNNKDNVGFAAFSDKTHNIIRPGGGKNHFYLVLNALLNTTPRGTTDLASSLKEIALSLPKRSLILVISDLHDFDEEADEGFKIGAALKHEVQIIHIHDPGEFPAIGNVGEVKFMDPESETVETIDLSDPLQRAQFMYEVYLRANHVRTFVRRMWGLNIQVVDSPTTVLVEQMLLAYFTAKSRGRLMR